MGSGVERPRRREAVKKKGLLSATDNRRSNEADWRMFNSNNRGGEE